jgi:hypothetical protein
MGRMIADAAFAERVWSTRWIPDRNAVHLLWERALQRGEVDPDVDGHAVLDDLVAVCLYRVALGHQVLRPDELDAIIERLLYGVLAARRQP